MLIKNATSVHIINGIFALIISLTFAFAVSAKEAKVAIIIDDMGYRLSDQSAFELPTHVTFAILPHTDQSKRFSIQAHQQGRTVLLHLPMETLKPQKLGPGALLASMNVDTIAVTLDQALKTVPNAVGVNNHMGSKLTQMSFPMTTLMEALSERHLFFIDSRTTRFTKAHKIAVQTGVPVLERRVFLDHELTQGFITQQFRRLLALSQKYGQAIGIAHPHPLTIKLLKRLIKRESTVNFVAVTELFDKPNARRLTTHNSNQSDLSFAAHKPLVTGQSATN